MTNAPIKSLPPLRYFADSAFLEAPVPLLARILRVFGRDVSHTHFVRACFT